MGKGYDFLFPDEPTVGLPALSGPLPPLENRNKKQMVSDCTITNLFGYILGAFSATYPKVLSLPRPKSEASPPRFGRLVFSIALQSL